MKIVNRAWMSTATTGTGTITLGSAQSGYQTFGDAGVSDGDIVSYTIIDGANWEIGTGTYTASGTTLTRTVLESSNADSAINLSGSATVFVTALLNNILGQGVLAPSQITADQDNYNPTGLAMAGTLRLDTDASRTITGIAGGKNNRILSLLNVGSNPIILSSTSTASTAANRFSIAGDIVIMPNSSAVIWYDSTASRWKALVQPVLGKIPVWVPATAMISRTTNGGAAGTVETTTNKVMLKTLDHDASTQEYHQFTIPAIKGWNKSTVTAKAAWKHAATATNFGVVWGLQGYSASDDDAADTAFGTAKEVADTGGTTNDIYWTAETAAITIAGTPATGDLIFFQGYRKPSDGSDTMAIDAGLLGWLVYLTMSSPTEN